MSSIEELQEEVRHYKALSEELILHSRRLGEAIRIQMETLLGIVHQATDLYKEHATYIHNLEEEELLRVPKIPEDSPTNGI